jgi:predicted HTH domain antitoxin
VETFMASLSVDMPEGVFSALHRTPEEFARAMRLAAAIRWYSRGEVCPGRGAEIAGLSRRGFLEALHRAEVPACQETIDELKEQVERDLHSRRERLAADPPGQDRPV